MLLWYVGPSVLVVWLVFRSPMADHRTVALGALLPLAEVVLGRPGPLHTLAGAVLVLAVVMAVTQGRRLVRRRWLGVPIGLFLHLVLSGSFTRPDLFWWPVTGVALPEGSIPGLDRPLGVLLVLEVLGLLACVWCHRAFGLDDPGRRDTFLRTGQIDRSLLPPS